MRVADIRLPGHPSGFEITENRTQVLVNMPDFRQIAIVDLIEPRQGGYARVARVRTVSGARTALFVSELDRLFAAIRAGAAEPAAIRVFRPSP